MAPVTVLFRSRLLPGAAQRKAELDDLVAPAAAAHEGLLARKTFTAEDGERVTIVEFADEASVEAWRSDPLHRAAKAERAAVYAETSTELLSPIAEPRRWRA